jgi:flagella synthesis protein FlgN
LQHSQSAQLVSALAAELSALQNFLELLGHEQSLLVENKTDDLLDLTERKSTLSISLNELAVTRRALLHKNIPELSVDSIQAWLKSHCTEGLPIWQQIRVLAEQAQQLNITNGELIQMKLRHNQQSLAVLSGAVNKANLYGPDGQTSFTPGSGRSLGNG